MSKPHQFYQGIVIALLLVIPTVVLSIYVFRQLEISALHKSDTQAVLRDATRLLSSVKDAEIGQRGFLLTSDVAFLAPYQAAIANIPIDLAKLARVRESSSTSVLVEELRPLVDAKMLELSRILALSQNGQPEQALAALRAGAGKMLMDALRSKIDLFLELETVHLAELDSQLNAHLKQMFLVIIAAGVAWMLFLLGFINLLYRQVEGRVSSKVKSQVHLETVSLLKAQTESVEKLQVANRALNDSSVLVETVLNSVADCVIRVRAEDGEIEYTNLATEKLFGYEDQALLGKPLTVILPDLVADISLFVGGEHEVFGRPYNGEELILNMSVRSMIQSERKYLICTLRDFTASKRIETALRTSELSLHNGIAVAGLGLGDIDYKQNTITLDEVASTLFDLPMGKPLVRGEVHRRFHPEDAAAVHLKMSEALNPGGRGFMAVEHRVVGDDGAVRWLSARKQVVFASNLAGERVAISGALAVRDISALKAMVLELALAREAAENANLAKSRFLSNMSHELRTPLNAILGFAQLIAAGTPPPNAKQQKSIDQILRAGWYLLELINEVLDLALIESGKLTLSSQPTDLASILKECQEMMEPQGKSRDVLLVFRAPESVYLLNADRTRVKQILLNLLSNAIKYNRKGGTVVVSCAVSGNNRLRISVADTGLGLSAQNLGQLFQPFNRLGQESFSEEGTGIGLVLSKRLIELMGGTIGAESTVGIGSQFWIEIGFEVPPQMLLRGPSPESSSQPADTTHSFKEAP
jgi:PAS domain S-box-containing protein